MGEEVESRVEKGYVYLAIKKKYIFKKNNHSLVHRIQIGLKI